MLSYRDTKLGGICAISGSLLLLLGTSLHPTGADPNQAIAAFTEYAADHLWVTSHLLQLAGVALMVAALLCLTQQLKTENHSAWTQVAAGGALVSLAMATVLQAVDGVALKTMVDVWAAAPFAQKEGAFQVAFAVRQIEIGLASMLSLSMGLTATMYGGLLFVSRTYPQWLGGLAILGGLPTAIAGVVIARTGFSRLAMTINMLASLLLLAWMLLLGSYMWRETGGERSAVSAAKNPPKKA